MTDIVLTELSDNIFYVILNRVDKRNAIDMNMVAALEAALDDGERAFNEGARAMIIRGEGKAFSAGIDLSALMATTEKFGEAWRNNLFPVTQIFQSFLNKLEAHSLPTICAMHGYCLGLGMELSLACDFRIIAERTLYGLPETRLGIIPDVGGTTRLVKLVGASRAKEIIMTGANIDLERAEKWGVVNYVVEKDELLPKAVELANEIALSAPLAVSYTKRVINDMLETAQGQKLEAWAQAQLFRTEDFEAGVQATITKSHPVNWQGK